ncbi:hypothetical protein QYE76_027662 [Lolium multiflorum]|uniref:Transposase (putative) gypsy type domain-containing protein n=1 Tax=Lolium multiflorum TaxID=4521 RepID=A0AAD8QMT6_LOLMU|nr:hypothetical protein QYE76_027662 [Lolium multiflorum]
MDTGSGSHGESGSSSQASGANPSAVTRGAWMGSNVSEYEIDWLYRSRRIPEGVTCRLPADEIEPVLEPGEHVVFLAHFERGFGLPASPFFRKFLDFYELQPHHLPGNAVFYLSCFTTFMEAYVGIRPIRETFARFFALRINSVQGKDIPAPKPPVQCGSCIVGSRQGSPFFKFAGLESCRAWQGTFFYMKNSGAADLINLPPFNPAPPSKANWSYNPRSGHPETNRVVRFVKNLMKETDICSDDIIRAFISRRVLPLQRRQHRMSEMYGPGDPTKITGLPLSKRDIVRKAKQICQTAMPNDWEWGLLPFSTSNPPTQEAEDRFPSIRTERRGPCVKRALDSVDPDPFIRWKDLKMGKTKASRLGPSVPKPAGSSDDLDILEIHEHVPPLQAEVGHEFVDKLTAHGQKNKAPASDAGSSEDPPSKRFRTEPLGHKEVGMRRYKRKQMPTSPGPALKLGPRPESSEGTARTSTPPPYSSPAPSGVGNTSASPRGQFGAARPLHRRTPAEEVVSKTQDAGASNIGTEEKAAGRAEPLVPLIQKKKKKTSAPGGSNPGDAPSAPLSPRISPTPPPEASLTRPTSAALTLPPPKTSKLIKGKAAASSAPSGGPQPLVLHASRAASAASEKATGLLGRITEFKRQGWELGHLLPYAEKWNVSDMSPATRGMGKDRLPLPDPAGDRSSEEHFMRLRRAVKELDSAWYDSMNNLMHTADARKVLFEELLWEHQELAEAHEKCQVIPEASIGALQQQVAALQAEKEQLIWQHREPLDGLDLYSKGLKDQLIQAGLKHNEAMKAAEATAATKLNEALEDANNSNAVLNAELEEMAKARKAAEEKAARLEAEQKEYDLLVMQTDALALRLFPDSQGFATKRVGKRRVAQGYQNLDAPWDPYDHLVALNARVSHMRVIDRNLSDIPEVATQLFRTLWPGEEVPDTFSLISDRLKGAGRRIREWQCSAARAGADAALRVACSWYPDLDLDALVGVREEAPTDMDPVLTAKRWDRAYHIAEFVDARTFIAAPPDVQDYLSEGEEGEVEEEAEADDEPLDVPGAGDAPPEAPAA